MPNNENIVHLRLKLEVAELDGRWCVRSDQFKSFVYGKTREDAEESFRQAVGTALNTFKDLASLSRYLDAAGVSWRLEPAEDRQDSVSYRELAVPVAVLA